MKGWSPNKAATTELARDPGIHAQVAEAARQGAAMARRFAPRKSGYFSSSIYADNDGEQAVVGSTDVGAVPIEVGSANNPAFAPIRRGVRAAGMRLDESR